MRKFRKIYEEFVAEGNKLVEDNLSSMKCHRLVATAEWWDSHESAKALAEECIEVTREEMSRVSLLQTPQEVLGTFHIPTFQTPTLKGKLVLVLDDVQDPGNMGTIIRLCDWFGIKDIICSLNTVDCYNPKTVQATMGAIARVKVHYTDLPIFLEQACRDNFNIYGTFLEGTNIYETNLSTEGIVLMGNEGNGISQTVAGYVTQKLNIPSYPKDSDTSESLNVAIATAITISEFRRRAL